MLIVLDWMLLLLHALLVLFNMVGWAWKRTRVLHLVTVGLTAFSWFVIGAFWGWGYCPCTDWHAQIRRQLGHADAGSTWLQQMIHRFFGFSLSRSTADWITGSVFAFIVLATLVAWTRERRRKNTEPDD